MNIATQALDNATWARLVTILSAIPRFEDSYTAWEALEGNDGDTRETFVKSVLGSVADHGLIPGIQHASSEQIATWAYILILGHSINSNNSREL